MFQAYSWDPHADSKTLLYANVLAGLSAMSQEYLPYHIDRVDSNDALYGGDPKFLAELEQIAATLLAEILAQVQALDLPETRRRQAQLCWELFNRIVAHANLTNRGVFTMATSCWTVAMKQEHLDPKLVSRSLESIESKGRRPGGKAYADLAKEISILSHL